MTDDRQVKQMGYVMALGAFRQQCAMLAVSARELGEAAKAFDPDGTSEPDEMVTRLFAECVAELRIMACNNTGMRQLFAAALEA